MDAKYNLGASLWSYYNVLKENRNYFLLWMAEVIDNIGAWLNYVAVLGLIERFAFQQNGLALSSVILVRFLPALLLAPIAGVVADSLNRVKTLRFCAIAAALSAAALINVSNPSDIGLLFFLLSIQFSVNAIYDPARRAMLPVLVPVDQLHIATTIDSFAWSITGAIGGALGGLLASRLGTKACFLIDSCTYLIAAVCVGMLPIAAGDPQALKKGTSSNFHGTGTTTTTTGTTTGTTGTGNIHEGMYKNSTGSSRSSSSSSLTATGNGNGITSGGGLGITNALSRSSPTTTTNLITASTTASSSNITPFSLEAGNHSSSYVVVKGNNNNNNDNNNNISTSNSFNNNSGGGGGNLNGLSASSIINNKNSSNSGIAAAISTLITTIIEGGTEGIIALKEGWSYVSGPENRDVAIMVTIKACGSLTWGAVDVLNVKISELTAMQPFGADASMTLGLIFAVVGIGCFVGPVGFNMVAPNPKSGALLWSVVASFMFLFLGSLFLAIADTFLGVVTATFVRSLGSSILWVVTTLMLQLRVENDILGRICALEMAFYTISEVGSSLFGGAAFDILHLTLQQVLWVLTWVAGGIAVIVARQAMMWAKQGGFLTKERRVISVM
jgi:MFS family permease